MTSAVKAKSTAEGCRSIVATWCPSARESRCDGLADTRRSAGDDRCLHERIPFCTQPEGASSGVDEMPQQVVVVDGDPRRSNGARNSGQHDGGLDQPAWTRVGARKQCELAVDEVGPSRLTAQQGRHARVAGEHRNKCSVRHGQLGVAAQHVLGAGIGAALSLRLGDDVTQLLEDRFDDGVEQLFTGAEVVIDGRLGEAHLVGDHLQRCAREAMPGEQVDGDVDQPLPGVGSCPGPAPQRSPYFTIVQQSTCRS